MAGPRYDTRSRTPRSASAPAERASLPFEPARWWLPAALITAAVVLYFLPLLTGAAFLWEDFTYYSYPVRVFAATSMAAGEIPLWNPYTFSGMPFAADMLTMVFYLPCIALTLAVKNGTLGVYWVQLMNILHFVLAGGSTYLLARSFGLQRIPSLFAGVAYMLTGYMVVHAIHQPVLTLASWIPLIAYLFRRALLERGWTSVFLAALVLGHSTLCGFPQLSLYIYFFLFAFWLMELFSAHHGRALLSRPALMMALRAASVVAISLAIAALQLLPAVELSELSQRAQVTYEFATSGSLAWSQLLTLLFPKLFGTAGPAGYAYWGPGTYWYYWETCIYVGVLPVFLALLSLRRWRGNRYIVFFWGVALVALLFALGNNFVLHKLMYLFVPGISRFRNPARITIFLALAVALLAAFSLQDLLHGQRSAEATRTLRRWVMALTGTGALLWLLLQSGALTGLLPYLADPRLVPALSGHLAEGLLVTLVSGGALYLFFIRGASRRWAGLVLCGILFGDLYLFGSTQSTSPIDPEAYFRGPERAVRFIKQQAEHEIFRVNTRNPDGMIMDRNQGLYDRIFTTEGYDPLALQRLYIPTATDDQKFDLLNIKYKTVTDRQAGTLALVPHPTYLPRAFFVYATRTVGSEEELLAYLKSTAFQHRTEAVLEKEPAIVLSADTTKPVNVVQIFEYQINAIALRVFTERPGFLMLSETYYPGWTVAIDGFPAELYRADYTLRGVFVPEGNHQVIFRFQPRPFRQGAGITIAALLLCGAGIIVPALRSRRAPEAS